MRIALLSFTLLIACSSPRGSSLQWPEAVSPSAAFETEEGAAESRPEAGEAETFKRNIVAVFTGYTTDRAGGGFTLGLDYERRINSWFGVGVFGEAVISEEETASAIGAGVYLRPVQPLVLVYTPGVEFEKGESGEFMMRVGAVYDLWKSEPFILAPAVYADIFHDEVKWVLGFNFAWEF